MLTMNIFYSVLQEVKEYFYTLNMHTINEKKEIDYVTNVDHAMDVFLTDKLQSLTPNIPVLSEERDIINLPEQFWIIDPLDGTHNFIENLPFYAVSIAFCEQNKVTFSAVIDLVQGDIYTAQLGHGAFINGQAFTLSRSPSELMCVSSGMLDLLSCNQDIYTAFRKTAKFRNLGCQSLQIIYVALGKFCAAMSYEAKFWDDAAAYLFLTEVGGEYYSFALASKTLMPNTEKVNVPLISIASHTCQYKFIYTQIDKLLNK
ncbi:MAG: inositol monophosphatase [Pseudomonadota bacterium]